MEFKRKPSTTMGAESIAAWVYLLDLLDIPGDTEVEPIEECIFSRPVL